MAVAIMWAEDMVGHLARHGVTIEQADEAFSDPNALVINPDYASLSGRGVRTVGWSPSFGDLISVLTVIDAEGVVHGATAFRAKGKDRRYYYDEEGRP